jgi:diketogulonate reductase-like aldo/keto reductase
VSVVSKTTNFENLKKNLDAVNIELSDKEIEHINRLDEYERAYEPQRSESQYYFPVFA